MVPGNTVRRMSSPRGFASDNCSGAHPRILEAIAAVNDGHDASYGADRETARLDELARAGFGPGARLFPMLNGTGTNVAIHLLTNAINFTPKLGHIALAATRNDDWIDITVSDSGPGIAKADRKRVLEPFGRVQDGAHPNKGSSNGPGLGLTIVKRFVELHGGAVDIRSNKSRGTTVICRIPVDADSVQGVASFDTDRATLDEHAAE